MPKDATLDRHLDRIQRVIDHIVGHLDDPIDLDRLAAVACFSPHHFHRAYRYLLGETVAETVRRLRLHRAAGTLLGSETAVARVASDRRSVGVPLSAAVPVSSRKHLVTSASRSDTVATLVRTTWSAASTSDSALVTFLLASASSR